MQILETIGQKLNNAALEISLSAASDKFLWYQLLSENNYQQ